MKRIFTFISALFLAHFAFGQIVITEIMYNPPESGTDSLEFVEIHNPTSSTVDMSGWSFSKGVTHVFADGFSMNAGEYHVLAVKESAFSAVFGSGIAVTQWDGGAFSNSGEDVEIVNASGEVVVSATYSNGSGGWYADADGNGASLELCNVEADPKLKTSWLPSVNNLGVEINGKSVLASPGSANSVNCDGALVIELIDFEFVPKDITINPGQIVRWVNVSGSVNNINGTTEAYADNPVGFTNGDPQPGNWTYEFQFDVEGIYTYHSDPNLASGMVGSIQVGEINEYNDYTIEELRANDGGGLPALKGEKVRTRAVVHTPNLRPAGLEFFIINSSNVGVSVFNSNNSLGYTVNEGDEVEVEGVLGDFRGLTQINVEKVTVISTGNTLVTPREVTDLSESDEGSLVKFLGDIKDKSAWTNQGSGFNVLFTNGQVDVNVRILAATELFGTDPLDSYISATGVVSQFSTTAPFIDGYQIVPRYLSDLDFTTSSREIEVATFDLSPNPADNYIRVEAGIENFHYNIFSITGSVVAKGYVAGNELTLDLGSIQPGVYSFLIFKDGFAGSAKLVINK